MLAALLLNSSPLVATAKYLQGLALGSSLLGGSRDEQVCEKPISLKGGGIWDDIRDYYRGY